MAKRNVGTPDTLHINPPKSILGTKKTVNALMPPRMNRQLRAEDVVNFFYKPDWDDSNTS